MISMMLLGVVSAVLLRSQVVFENPNYNNVTKFVSYLILLTLPMISVLTNINLGEEWRDYFYYISYSLFGVSLITLDKEWHKSWPLILLWPLMPFIYTGDSLSLWLSIIMGEFLLIMAFLEHPFRSDYHKFAMLRIIIIFQYFLFDYLFINNRVGYTPQIMAVILISIYCYSLYELLLRVKLRQPKMILFLLTFIQFGVMIFDKVLLDTFGINS